MTRRWRVPKLTETPELEAFGRELRRAREESGLSLRALAEAVAASHTVVSDWERGRHAPRPPRVRMVGHVPPGGAVAGARAPACPRILVAPARLPPPRRYREGCGRGPPSRAIGPSPNRPRPQDPCRRLPGARSKERGDSGPVGILLRVLVVQHRPEAAKLLLQTDAQRSGRRQVSA